MNPITPSRLREVVDRILDQVLETGVPVEIVRAGRRLRVVESALDLDWRRDAFDRLITAQAAVADVPRITRDRTIRANYENASR